jgi:hypothetical protein
MFIEKRTALGKSLGMGVDRIDIFHFRPRQSQQMVLNFYQFFTDDGAAAAPDKVIDFRNSPGGGVFNGDNAVINHSSRSGFRHIFKEGEIYFFPLPLTEVPFHGLIGIGAFRAVTANADPFFHSFSYIHFLNFTSRPFSFFPSGVGRSTVRTTRFSISSRRFRASVDSKGTGRVKAGGIRRLGGAMIFGTVNFGTSFKLPASSRPQGT